jgi:hypothetical protein
MHVARLIGFRYSSQRWEYGGTLVGADSAVFGGDHFRFNILVPIHLHAGDVINYLKLGHGAGHAVIFFYVISGFLIMPGLTLFGSDWAISFSPLSRSVLGRVPGPAAAGLVFRC